LAQALSGALVLFWKFLPAPHAGLPDLSPTLVALTGVAAAGYATKKGLETNIPTLTGVYPAAAAPGEPIIIRGKNLTISSGAEGEDSSNQVRVLFGGRHVQTVQLPDVKPTATDEIRISVPAGAEPGNPTPVTVIRADGIATEELPFDVIAGGPRITNVSPNTIVIGLDREIVIDGVSFVSEDGQRPSKNDIKLRGRTLRPIGGWGTGRVRARLPDNVRDAEARGFAIPSSTELVVYDDKGRKSRPEPVELVARKTQ